MWQYRNAEAGGWHVPTGTDGSCYAGVLWHFGKRYAGKTLETDLADPAVDFDACSVTMAWLLVRGKILDQYDHFPVESDS